MQYNMPHQTYLGKVKGEYDQTSGMPGGTEETDERFAAL